MEFFFWLVLLKYILMQMTTKLPLKMSERAFVCQLTLLNIDTYSNILIESSINTNEIYFRVNEKRIYVIVITFGINESIFSGNEQQKVYVSINNVNVLINAFTAVGALRALIDFTLSNAKRFYSSMGNPLAVKYFVLQC